MTTRTYFFWLHLNISTMRDLAIYYVVFCCAANCEHTCTGGNNIMFTFYFHTAIVFRKGNWHFVFRFKEGKLAFRPSFYGTLQTKEEHKPFKPLREQPKWFRNHPNTNSTTFSKLYGAKRIHNVHVIVSWIKQCPRFLN